MDAQRIAQIRRIKKRAMENGKPSGPGEVITLCDEILEMHEENRRWDMKWKRLLKAELRRPSVGGKGGR